MSQRKGCAKSGAVGGAGGLESRDASRHTPPHSDVGGPLCDFVRLVRLTFVPPRVHQDVLNYDSEDSVEKAPADGTG